MPPRVLPGALVDRDPCRVAAVMSRPKREAVQLLDVRDPARPGAEAVVSIDPRADLAVGDRTWLRPSGRLRPGTAPLRSSRTGPWIWFHVGSCVPRCSGIRATFAALRVIHVATDYVLFDFAFQTQAGSLELLRAGP